MDYVVATLLVAAWCIAAPTLFLLSVTGEEEPTGSPASDRS